MTREKMIKNLKHAAYSMGLPEQGTKWSPNGDTIAIEGAIDILEKLPEIESALKHYLDINEENGVVYIPKFAVEKMIAQLQSKEEQK